MIVETASRRKSSLALGLTYMLYVSGRAGWSEEEEPTANVKFSCKDCGNGFTETTFRMVQMCIRRVGNALVRG